MRSGRFPQACLSGRSGPHPRHSGYGIRFPRKVGRAYIGLLLMDPGIRAQGLGRRFLDHLVDEASRRRMLGCRARRQQAWSQFWEREGFVLEKTFEPQDIGLKKHILRRLVRPLWPASVGTGW
nr:GNAT family N-acetyltransferase [Mesorhizobium sp. IRAMC:0171]